jgi:hypothetical protein
MAKSTGERCTQPPTPGATVCRYHGGAAPQVQAAAARRLLARAIEGDAAAVLAHEGITGISDPVEQLSLLAAEVRAFLDNLGKRVNALTDVRYQGGQGEQLRAELQLFERAQDRLIRVLDALAKLDLEGKRQAARERYAAEIVGLLQMVLEDLALSQAQWALLPQVMARRLGAGLQILAPAAQLVELEEGDR